MCNSPFQPVVCGGGLAPDLIGSNWPIVEGPLHPSGFLGLRSLLEANTFGIQKAGNDLPSSLDSLAQGCRVLGIGEVLGSNDGTLAPDHDGFCPDVAAAAEVRATFDEAEPMATHRDVDAMTSEMDPGYSGPTKGNHTNKQIPSEPLDSFSHL